MAKLLYILTLTYMARWLYMIKLYKVLRNTNYKFEGEKEKIMLETIIVILVILWLLGLVGGFSGGGLIHLLLVIAAVVLIIRLVSGRKVV